jgi:chromatin segregation and condensation protein Rec8/ScpA/Scc1 (kleisin family)
MLESRGRIEFLDLFDEEVSVTDVLSVLVALLELARVGRLRLKQRKLFGKMGISDGTPVTTG